MPLWKTKSGKLVPLEEMASRHLRACMRILEARAQVKQKRRLTEYLAKTSGTNWGEENRRARSQQINRINAEGWRSQVDPIYMDMEDELKRRREYRPKK